MKPAWSFAIKSAFAVFVLFPFGLVCLLHCLGVEAATEMMGQIGLLIGFLFLGFCFWVS